MRTLSCLLVLVLFACIAEAAPKSRVCIKVVPQLDRGSRWCQAPPVPFKPLRPGLKVGRQTVFSGPIEHKGICNYPLHGSASMAAVALSSKYLSANYRGIYPDPGCFRCICVRIRSWDPKYSTNPYAAKTIAPKYYGKIFKAQVQDQCSECEDDHIDILTDAPYTTVPYSQDNPLAGRQNAKFGGPKNRLITVEKAYTVGTWIVDWGFVSCKAKCTKAFFKPAPKKRTTKKPAPKKTG